MCHGWYTGKSGARNMNASTLLVRNKPRAAPIRGRTTVYPTNRVRPCFSTCRDETEDSLEARPERRPHLRIEQPRPPLAVQDVQQLGGANKDNNPARPVG